MDVQEVAKRAAGNWRKFESFGWHDRPDDADEWTIVYTHNRDSGLIAQSNAAAIEKILAPFMEQDDPDVTEEHHGHWAVGWVDGYSIRVFRDGKVTKAFEAWCDICAGLEDYPLIDEQDHSNREYEAALESIGQRSKYVADNTPEGWESEVFSWLWDNEQRECCDRGDDQGAWPSDESIKRALSAIGKLDPYYETEDEQ